MQQDAEPKNKNTIKCLLISNYPAQSVLTGTVVAL
jgi:hypothetical protein